MLSIDLRGKRALVAGVADDGGYGFAIAKALAEAGATVCTGTWPPALNIFLNLLERGKIDEPRRISDCRERQCLLAGLPARAVGPADAARRVSAVPHLPGGRACGARVRWRDVVGQGGARERHPYAGIRGRAQIRHPGEHDLGRSARLTRRKRDRQDREDGAVL